VLTPYLTLLRRPGAFRFSSAAFVARLPMAMLGLGVVLFLTLRGEPYAVAGGVSAVGAVSNALIGPFVSRYIDRYSQHKVIPIVVAIALVFQLTFIALVLLDAPVWTWFVCFGLGEAFVPNFGSLARARWAYVLDEPQDVRTAFAYESVIDEVVFVAGPPVATLLAISLVTWGAIGASIVLMVVGTVMLVPLRATEPPAAGSSHIGGKAAARYAGVPLVAGVFFFVGAVFGSNEVVTVAFAAEYDVRGWTGLLLALYALGSGIAGLVLGTLHLRTPLPTQFRTYLVLVALVGLPFPFIGSPVLLGVAVLVAGFAVAPSLITGFALVERLVPSQRLTEGLTVVMAGLTVGFATGTSISGPIIDRYGASTAFWVLTVSALLASGLGVLGTPHLRRALAGADADNGVDAQGDPA
jgi:MFS family permease